MGSERRDEVERTFDVEALTTLPTLVDLDDVLTLSPPVELRLEAVYFDTAGLDLARHGVTLRRRTGGEDAGWHLKLPRGKDTRTELHRPLGRATKTVPRQLAALVRGLARGRRLVPVARVATRRLEHTLIGPDDVLLARLCDDHVQAERLHGTVLVQSWREWECELVDGDRSLLDRVEQRFRIAGAVPASAASKLARCLGDALPLVEVRPSRRQLTRGSAAGVLLPYLATHLAVLVRHDARLRSGDPGSVHQLRISARRLRSALRTYRPLLEADVADPISAELRWLGQTLSDARDAQVLRERLGVLVADERPELVLGPVMDRIDEELRAAQTAGQEEALRAFDSERYYRLLDSLDELVGSAPLTDRAHQPARKVLPRLLQRDARRLRRAVRRIDRAGSPQQRDVALHEARKKAKRLRYAADAAVPVLGKRAKTLRTRAKQVQEALGEHHDTVVARAALHEYGVRAHADGENAFTFGRLHALEQARGERAERDFETAWRNLPHQDLRRWLRS